MWTYPYFSKLNTKDNNYNTKIEAIDKTSSQSDSSSSKCCSETTDCNNE